MINNNNRRTRRRTRFKGENKLSGISLIILFQAYVQIVSGRCKEKGAILRQTHAPISSKLQYPPGESPGIGDHHFNVRRVENLTNFPYTTQKNTHIQEYEGHKFITLELFSVMKA